MPGIYFDEFAVGQIFDHELRRTITEADNMSFSLMTMNPQPLHIDRHFAKGTEWGEPLVNSLLTLGLVIGLSVQDTTLGTTIGNLGMTDTRFPAPVLQGDTVSARTTVVSLRASKSKQDRGIVEFKHEGFNQRGDLVCECVRQAMMLKRPVATT